MVTRFRIFIGVLVLGAALGVALIVRGHERSTVASITTPPYTGGYCVPGGLCTSPQTASVSTTTHVQTNATVLRVVDGDTFIVRLDTEPGEWTVRMLGINTPETVDPRKPVQCFGKQASARLHELLTDKRVRLQADSRADERDRYDRLLRNVMLEDGTDVNVLMVRDGYAYAYLSFPLNPARKSELKQLQEQAKANGVGLWSNATCSGKS